jgi:uncharacterized membrane protein
VVPEKHPGWQPDKLRLHREAHGLSQEAAGEQLRVVCAVHGLTPPSGSFQMIGRHERGEVYPGPHYRRAYCLLYDATEPELGFRPPLPGERVSAVVSAPAGGHGERVREAVAEAPLSHARTRQEAVTGRDARVARHEALDSLRQHFDDTGHLDELKYVDGVIDLDLRVDIDIAADGWARLSYRHELLNTSELPFARLARELWFENTRGSLVITPHNKGDRNVVIQRIHDTASLAKFACQISPPLRLGESAVIQYSCEGGQFLRDHYWRQATPRYTRRLTLNMRHRGAMTLTACSAFEERTDGSEVSAVDGLVWIYDGNDVIVTVTREFLRPTQSVTLRWVVAGVPGADTEP